MSESANPVETSDEVKKYLSTIGLRGGQAGKGASKARGDREYYRQLRAKTKRNPVKKDAAQEAIGDVVV